MERSLYVKLKDWMSNSVDPDETAHNEPSHLDLCCLQKPIIIACGSEKVKALSKFVWHSNVVFFLFIYLSEEIRYFDSHEMSGFILTDK